MNIHISMLIVLITGTDQHCRLICSYVTFASTQYNGQHVFVANTNGDYTFDPFHSLFLRVV